MHSLVHYTHLCSDSIINIHMSFYCRYPPQELPNVVVSELELWEVESNIIGCCSLSYWRSVFNRRPDYNIILQQRDLDRQGQMEASATFVLYESSALESSQQAFEKIRSTLEPLLDDGSVMMTQRLLEEIITPNPREASCLVFDLVEIREKNVCIRIILRDCLLGRTKIYNNVQRLKQIF